MASPSTPTPDDRSPTQWERLLRERPQQAQAEFVAAFERWRNDVPVLAAFARHDLRSGRIETARGLLHRAHRLAPAHAGIRCDLGWAELAAGATTIAQNHFEAVLACAPDDAAAHRGLAVCLLRQTGHADQAVAHLECTLRAQPDAPELLLELAKAATAAGHVETAERCYLELERQTPNDPSWWLSRATFLRSLGRGADALARADRYGRSHPREPAAWLEKARCLLALDRRADAMRWLEKLETRQPDIAENSAIYGECLDAPAQSSLRARHWVRAIAAWTAAGHFEPAQALADRLLIEQPQCAAGWDALARLHHARQRWGDAETAWRRALACDPSLLDAAAGLAHLYEDTNRADAAAAVAHEGLRCVPAGAKPSGAIELHLALAKAARRARDTDVGLAQVACAEALAATDAQHEFVAFERGRLLEIARDDADAFAAFARGNALALAAWQQAHPGRNAYLAGIESMLEHVRNGGLQAWRPLAGMPTSVASPAFLVGFPRSGTSLLNQVLDGHERMQTLEEKPPTQKMLAAVRAMPGGYPQALAKLDAIDVEYLRDLYFRCAAEHGASDRSKRLLDKFPLHINLAALIHRVFPDARFVFALRHPCDAVLSCFMQQFRLNHAMANFCTLEDTVALYERTMALWDAVRTRLPLAVHTIRYEDVVADFDSEVGALCGFLGVPWHADLRGFAGRARERGRIDTPSYAQVSRPLYADAVYRWERYRTQLAPVQPLLQPWIERFGYA
ncbi:MAG: sulfotransferase [Proteobacteria bacterium]|nr:sulfotransferase [Pseudomonadota bacterium]